ncbi:MAG TPA: hypothetical protein VFJ84_00240, partial [Candidatus Saccharimonadales bacterium]|nr:hypothetical protein [Candidatus Saccharimonadales bacterium]
ETRVRLPPPAPESSTACYSKAAINNRRFFIYGRQVDIDLVVVQRHYLPNIPVLSAVRLSG